MLDKLFAMNQTILIRNDNGPPDRHTRIVRNIEVTQGRTYGEVTIDGETWVVRHDHRDRWQSVGKKVDLDACIQGLEEVPLTTSEKQLATVPWSQCTRARIK
jgi:hypothetical protein